MLDLNPWPLRQKAHGPHMPVVVVVGGVGGGGGGVKPHIISYRAGTIEFAGDFDIFME